MSEAIRKQADSYRQRAEEVRAKADGTSDPECREALRRLAGGYERLAENLDRVADRSLPVRADSADRIDKTTRLLIVVGRRGAL